MQDDAIDKVRAGLTTMEEVLRVVPVQEAPALRCVQCSHELAQIFLFCPFCGVKKRAAADLDSVPVYAGRGGDVV